MKKFYQLIILQFLSLGLFAQAPSYVDFEWDILQLGYAFSSGDDKGAGAFGGTEVRYNATDRFAIGLGFSNYDTTDDTPDMPVSTGNSFLLGEYYFRGDSGQRPFVGLGTGLNIMETSFPNDSQRETITSTYGMFAPRVGYEFNHVRIMAQYGIVPSVSQNNFFSLSVGFTLWGGYKGYRDE